MDFTKHLIALGEEKVKVEIIYLQLRIEKALSAELFTKDKLLSEAKELMDEVSNEYFNFFAALQGFHKNIAA